MYLNIFPGAHSVFYVPIGRKNPLPWGKENLGESAGKKGGIGKNTKKRPEETSIAVDEEITFIAGKFWREENTERF